MLIMMLVRRCASESCNLEIGAARRRTLSTISYLTLRPRTHH